MFRDWNDRPKNLTTINCLLIDGGLGDHIGALVAVDYIIKNFPWLNLLVWVPDYMLDFAKNVLPNKTIVRNYSDAKNKYDNTRTGISTRWVSQFTAMRTHPVIYSFCVLCDYLPKLEEMNYLKVKFYKVDLGKIQLPDKYVCIQAAFTEKVKTMPTDTINEIAQYVKSKGYTPVFMGKTENLIGHKKDKLGAKVSEVDFSIGLNLIDKTNMLQSAKVIQGAKAFVGMDSGLTHIAGSTDTELILGYTFINPSHNLPVRNSEVGYKCHTVIPDEKELGCTFCQTKMNFVYGLDYRSCFYKDYKCLNYMKSDKFINHLEKIL